MLYDLTNRTGFLYNKMRNRNRVNPSNQNNDDEPNIENVDMEDLIQFFKNCVVHDQKDELKTRMETSVTARRIILADPKTNIHIAFPFYFVDVDLVCFFLICTCESTTINNKVIFTDILRFHTPVRRYRFEWIIRRKLVKIKKEAI